MAFAAFWAITIYLGQHLLESVSDLEGLLKKASIGARVIPPAWP